MEDQVTEDVRARLGSAKVTEKPRSPMEDAFTNLDKALAGLDINIDSLDIKLQPLSLRRDEVKNGESVGADRPPNSDIVTGINGFTDRVIRAAHRISHIKNDLEL